MQHLRRLTSVIHLCRISLPHTCYGNASLKCLLKSNGSIVCGIKQRVCYSIPSINNNSLANIYEKRDKKLIKIEWSNGKIDEFANIFLRDHCRCPQCYDELSSNRLCEAYTIPLDVSPVNIEVVESSVTIKWSDSHVSNYTFDYLQNVQQGLHQDVRYLPPKLWRSSDLNDTLPVYLLEDIVHDESKTLDWFLDLKQVGATKVTDAGTSLEVLDYCKDKLFGGYYKATHYGHTFKVISKTDATNLAYTSEKLYPHVDLPHFQHMPGIQILHCMIQTGRSGGESILVDGFQAAEQLKTLHPDSHDFLTQYKVRYRDIGSDAFGEFETFCERPIIQLNEDGSYEGIYHIGFQRDYGNHGSVEDIQMFYKSMHRFTQLLLDEDNVFTFKLKSGEILMFDNTRILHGRTGFETDPDHIVQESSSKQVDGHIERFLHGCYVDWDQIYWKIRPIKRRVESKTSRTIDIL